MGILNVVAAAAGSWLFGAVWYMALSRPWMEAAGIPRDADGKPMGNGSPLPFVLSAVCMILVAGMMRHVFQMSSVDTLSEGLTSGIGVGLFFIAPWIMINNAYGQKPFRLTLIDGGYAVIGCAIIGAVLVAF